MSRAGKFIETESRLVVAGGWGRGEWRVTVNGDRVLGGGDKMSWNERMVTVVPHCEWTKCH